MPDLPNNCASGRTDRANIALFAVVALSLIACQRLPSDLVALADQVPARIEAETARTSGSERAFDEYKETEDFAVVQRYAESEGWTDRFSEARAKIRAADAVLRQEIQPLLERDQTSEAEQLRAALSKINPLLAAARDAAGHWTARRDFLQQVASDPAAAADQCTTALAEMHRTEPDLQARASRAKSDHAARAAEIDELVGPLSALLAAAEEAASSASAEFAKIRGGDDGDLALLGDSCRLAAASRDKFVAGAAELGAKLGELDRSYSRTLIDMRADYSLVLRRQTWNERFDYPALHNLEFRVDPVSSEVFEGVASVGGSLAYLSRGWRGLRIGLASGLDRQHWDALSIDPFVRWPDGDTNGEIWVESGDVKYFHKYLIQEDGQTTESDWTAVNEEFFLANLDNLGMDVESKAYGSFESERLAHAAPPGMAFVGNPHYGRWVSDGSGGTFWSWAGPYLFYSSLFGSPMRYGRSDWDTWSRDYRGDRPFYGGSSAAPRWGSRSRSVQTSPKMQGSTFARGGGFRRPPASVRSVASRSRGGMFGASGK
ncbi:MAG: hypothetical protein OXN89_08845 [Bryobacterales bacterium]|nr:hypothetical protein [Bryobacterales bacterium]